MKKDLVNQFDPFLNEGDSRLLINFAVSHSTGSYRTTRHAYKIGFLSTTRVRQCEGLPAELNGFEPINYKDLIDGNLNADYLIGKLCFSVFRIRIKFTIIIIPN